MSFNDSETLCNKSSISIFLYFKRWPSINGNVFRSGNVQTMTLTGTNQFQYNQINYYNYIIGGTTTTIRSMVHDQYKNIEFLNTLTFTGATGVGAIGQVTIPQYQVPIGFFISEVLVDVGTGLTGSGAVLNLGIAVDATQAALNDTTGAIVTLNSAGVTKILPSTFIKATAARLLVLEVKTAAITAGTMTFIIKLNKLN